MKLKINIEKNIYLLFIFLTILDFGGAFGLRYAAWVIMISYIFLNLVKGKYKLPKAFLLVEGTLFFFYPVLLVGYSSIVHSVPLSQSLSEMTSFAIISIYIFTINLKSKRELIDPIKTNGFFFSVLIIIMFILLLILIRIGNFSQINSIREYAYLNRIGYIGTTNRIGIGLSPNVYFRWSLILVPLSVMFFKDNTKRFVVILTSILMVSSTGVVLFSGIGVVLCIYYSGKKKRKTLKSLFSIMIIFVIILGISRIIDLSFITEVFTSDSVSTNMKLKHIESAIKVIFESPETLLFGTGIGSLFYTTGTNEFVSNIEVSHINMIRQFGIIYFLLFTLYVIKLSFNLLNTDDEGIKLGVGLISFFVAAGTNPLLLSPIFILYLVLSKTYLIMHIKNKNELERLGAK